MLRIDRPIRALLERLIAGAVLGCSGCAVVAVADLAVTAGATVVKTAVKATGAVVDAIIPDAKPAKK